MEVFAAVLLRAKKNTGQKTKTSVNDAFSTRENICSFLRICSHLLRKSLIGDYIFSAVNGFDTVDKDLTYCCQNLIIMGFGEFKKVD